MEVETVLSMDLRATEDATVSEGTVTYDIRFYALIPGTENRLRLIINAEAQYQFSPGYPLISEADRPRYRSLLQ